MTDLTWHRHADLSIDQNLALRTAAVRLTEEFSDIYGPETIERILHSSDDQFATGSLLAERFERRVRVLLDELAVPVSRG
jgi:arsenate reductase